MQTQISGNKRALWYAPTAGRDRQKVVLFMPGLPGYPNKHDPFVDFFNRRGLGVLRPLYTGTHDSAGQITVNHGRNDFKLWYRFLERGLITDILSGRQQRYRRPEIIVFSTSYGSLLTGIMLNKFAMPRTHLAIFLTPLWNMTRYAHQVRFKKMIKAEHNLFKLVFPLSHRFKNLKKFTRQISGLEPLSGMTMTTLNPQIKILVLAGRSDMVTPPGMAQDLVKARTAVLPKSPTSFYLLSGGHSSKIDLSKSLRLIGRAV